MKKIMTAKILPHTNRNCIPQDETESSIFRPSLKQKHCKDAPSEAEDEDPISFDLSSLSQFTSCVVTYISGWVVRKLKTKVKCDTCLSALEDFSPNRKNWELIVQKNNGGLLNLSNDVVKICKTAETAFRKEGDISPSFSRVRIQRQVLLSVMNNNIFECLNGHLFDTESGDNHIVQLSKLITNQYLTLRMHHSANSLTLQNKPTTTRNRNTTITHFSGV
jgi:hypothetical protein